MKISMMMQLFAHRWLSQGLTLHHPLNHVTVAILVTNAIAKITSHFCSVPPEVVYMLTQEWYMPYILTCSSM